MAKAPNPIRLLRMITLRQWNFFAVAFCAWVSQWESMRSARDVTGAGWLIQDRLTDVGRL